MNTFTTYMSSLLGDIAIVFFVNALEFFDCLDLWEFIDLFVKILVFEKILGKGRRRKEDSLHLEINSDVVKEIQTFEFMCYIFLSFGHVARYY